MNEKIKRLLELVKENPELPIVPMVDVELVDGDDFGICMGAWGNSGVDFYIIDSRSRVLFRSDDVFEVLEHYLSKEEFEALPEAENECRTIFEALP